MTVAELKKELDSRILLIRRVEERIKATYHLGKMRSPSYLYMGHEAVAVRVCAALLGWRNLLLRVGFPLLPQNLGRVCSK